MMDVLPLAVFLMGPTASGKTDLALQLAEKFPFEIISVDSALIYRGLDIGTAKPSTQILEKYPHHLIDILDPAQAYSAAQFIEDALMEMKNIISKGRVPLLVGGTMLYFRLLQTGLSELPEANDAIRAELNKELESKGVEALHAYLASIDPEAAARIHCNDPQRVLRAIEVFRVTGMPLTKLQGQPKQHELPYNLVKIAISPADRSVLHKRIEDRFDNMLENGFIEEVENLRARGDLTLNNPSMRAVGYRQVWDFLSGLYQYSEMRDKGIIATRQLAKRQFTWLRGEENLAGFADVIADYPKICQLISAGLELD